MKITTTQLRQIIREEIKRMSLNEAKAFYTFFSGIQAVQGDSLSSVKNVAKDGMDPEDVQNIGACYETKVGKYTVYVITHAKKPKDKWCVITPYSKELEDNEISYSICRKAMATPGKPISFQDILKK
jgi:hypothetical protein